MAQLKCGTVATIMESIASKRLAEDWDNVGLIIGDRSSIVNKILVCLDLPLWVVEEAVENKVDMIITHHPLIFDPLKKINSDTVLGKKIIKLIKNNISVYSCHTNFDIAQDGLNDIFAKQLGFEKTEVMKPISEEKRYKVEESDKGKALGLGRIGRLENSVTLASYAAFVKKTLNIDNVRYSGPPDASIKNIAILNGAGNKFISTAKFSGADVLVTGDIQYHQMIEALEEEIYVIDAGHFGTEKIMMKAVSDYLITYFKGKRYSVEVMESKSNIDTVVNL